MECDDDDEGLSESSYDDALNEMTDKTSQFFQQQAGFKPTEENLKLIHEFSKHMLGKKAASRNKIRKKRAG